MESWIVPTVFPLILLLACAPSGESAAPRHRLGSGAKAVLLRGETSETDSSETCCVGKRKETAKGACTASYGAKIGYPVCCGQNGTVTSSKLICPIDFPVCTGYKVHGNTSGICQDTSNETTAGACTASYGAKVGYPVCCAQDGTVLSAKHICPKDLPVCFGYVQGGAWGACQTEGNKLACPRGYECGTNAAAKNRQKNAEVMIAFIMVIMFIIPVITAGAVLNSKGDKPGLQAEELGSQDGVVGADSGLQANAKGEEQKGEKQEGEALATGEGAEQEKKEETETAPTADI